MTNTRTMLGRWLVGLTLVLSRCGAVQAQEEIDAIFRGQSPYAATFVETASPWLAVSQPTVVAPQSYSTGPFRLAQDAPIDPFATPPFGGTPTFGDPGLVTPFLEMPAVWQPYVAAQGKAGNYNSSLFGQIMMPLYQDGQTLLFADIRGRFDDSSNSEGNFGLAVRTMIDPTWFVGLNGFYDRKHTDAGNNFNQGTVGIEAMSVRYEARMNGYIPESGAKAANSASTTEFEAGTIFVKGGLERAYYGLDGELGALLWETWGGNLELRGFAGGFWFDTSDNAFPSVAGPKGRLELRFYDLSCFGPQSRLTFGIELQYDDVRDTQVYGLARLEIPIGVFPGSRPLTRLERRMLDRIVRDDDIITVTGQGPREVGIDSLTNRPLTNVTLVDATTDAVTPIATAVTNAGANSTVVVNGIAGPINTPGNITPLTGQVVRGGGFQVIGSQTGATANFGVRPTINSTNAANNLILLNNNFSTVADLDLVGGQRGVYAAAARTGVLVSGNSVTRAADDGFEFNGLDVSSVVQNNTSRSNGRNADGTIANTNADGFEFNGTTAGIVRGNQAINNADSGFDFTTLSGTMDRNTATGNGGAGSSEGRGLFLSNLAASGVVSNNVFDNNFFGGLQITGAIPAGGLVTGNTANRNGRDAAGTIVSAAADGFRFDGTLSGTISNNSASFNADRGFEFNSNIAAGGRVTGNSAIQNFGRGFHFGSTIDAGSVVSGNIAQRNGFNLDGTPNAAGIDGFVFNAAVSGLISDNLSENNQQAGYFIESLQAAGSVINNTAANNPFAGFFFNTLVAGVVDGNTAIGSGAGGYGFDFIKGTANLAATARVTDNIAAFNDGGFGFNNIAVGSLISGNTARFNGFTPNGIPLAGATSGNGFDFFQQNFGTITGNFALGNANNGFAGGADNNFTNGAVFGVFSNNLSNTNGDMGYRGVNAGTAVNNLGSGNVNGGNTFP